MIPWNRGCVATTVSQLCCRAVAGGVCQPCSHEARAHSTSRSRAPRGSAPVAGDVPCRLAQSRRPLQAGARFGHFAMQWPPVHLETRLQQQQSLGCQHLLAHVLGTASLQRTIAPARRDKHHSRAHAPHRRDTSKNYTEPHGNESIPTQSDRWRLRTGCGCARLSLPAKLADHRKHSRMSAAALPRSLSGNGSSGRPACTG